MSKILRMLHASANLSVSLHQKQAAGQQLRVGELKSMLYLALGELELALDGQTGR